MSLRKFHIILYFNIFRFHCFCTSWIAKRRYTFLKLSGLVGAKGRRYKNDNGDDDLTNDLQAGFSLFLTDRFMGMLYAFVGITLWNLVAALLQMNFYSWKYGLFFWMAVTLLSILLINHEYLKDFKKFRSWSVNESRNFAIITLLVVCGIFFALIGSFGWYLSIAIGNKP